MIDEEETQKNVFSPSLPPSFFPSLPSSVIPPTCCASLDMEDTTVKKNSESPPIPDVISGEAVLVSRRFQIGRD